MSVTEESIAGNLLAAADLDQVVSSMSWIESHPVTSVRIDSLVFEDSPRLGGEDQAHVRMLAEAGVSLPSITVHRPTMRVIDGAHRVRAAQLNGHTMIDARLIDCDDSAAFVLAVKANVTHGLPLLQSDRAAAAARIIMTHPHWSDRAVAAATALSDKTVSKIRARSAVAPAQPGARLGRDGRLRPLDSGRQRQQAAAMLRERPHAGLREVARATSLSPATVRDVRARIDRGEDPVPGKYRNQGPAKTAALPAEPRPHRAPVHGAGAAVRTRTDAAISAQVLLTQLSEDPSVRLSEAGRHTVRLLHRWIVDCDGLARLGRGLPDHWAPDIADLARSCAAAWGTFADQLQQRDD